VTTVQEPATRTTRASRLWTLVAVVEVVVATALVVLDVLIPSLVILVLAAVSVAVRRVGFTSLGFHRVADPWRLAGTVFAIVLGWSLLQLGLVMPVLNHLTGEKQDLDAFEDLQGNVGLLVTLVLASWVLGALAEETAIRGWFQTRVTDILGRRRLGILVAVLFTSTLFAVLHLEQGAVGVVVTFLDALLFSWLRWHYRSVWAAVLGHGLSNTVGVITFFLIGPVYGLW
jgi:membrane protease YdiL (CAAX protease family)